MKSIKYMVLTVIGSMFLTTCQRIETLKRDNPLDNPNTKARIEFNGYKGNIRLGIVTEMKISLKNAGKSTAYGVKATYSTTSSYVTTFYTPPWPTTISYGNISSNTVKWVDHNGNNNENFPTPTVSFSVSNTTPKGTQIPINISIVDDNGNRWTDSFYVPVE